MMELALYYRDIKKVPEEYAFWRDKAERFRGQFNVLSWYAALRRQ